MQVIARVLSHPNSDRWSLAGGVIVEHDVDVESGRNGLFGRGQELAQFRRPVSLLAAADDPTGNDVQGGEQRCRAAALAVMAAPLDLSSAASAVAAECGSSASICDFSSTHSTSARSGGGESAGSKFAPRPPERWTRQIGRGRRNGDIFSPTRMARFPRPSRLPKSWSRLRCPTDYGQRYPCVNCGATRPDCHNGRS